MQNSSAFQYIAIDQIDLSHTNPRQTFDERKLEELAASIREHGIIQPITVRPQGKRFELVAGERRYRAALIAEHFSLPAHVKELSDAQAIEWQLVENSQRVDVHPYEEAQGFQRLLDMPGHDVAALVAKCGKSASHIYGRLSLLQLIPEVATAFVEERITASHANLIARLPEAHQADAFANCWRKDWSDSEPHLLPAKHLSAWIETHLYLALSDAPFDREDTTLHAAAGACVDCPRRSGYNTSLFADVQADQCLDSACFESKVNAHIERELATHPELVQIETAWRQEKRPDVLAKHSYRALDTSDNPDAEPPCAHTRSALIVFGKDAGKTVPVCIESHCPVHDPATASRLAAEEAAHPAPVMESPVEEETEEEAAQRVADYEQRCAEHEAERQKREAEEQAEEERQQKAYEQEQNRREKVAKSRKATFERILEQAPAAFDANQFRAFLRLVVRLDPYSFLESLTDQLAGEESSERTEVDIVLAALGCAADAELPRFALRLALIDHLDIPREDDPDLLAEAEAVFAPPQTKADGSTSRTKPKTAKAEAKKTARKANAA